MPIGLEIWASEILSIEMDGDCVRVRIKSGLHVLQLRTSRATFRLACEAGRRLLDADDIDTQDRIRAIRETEH